MGALTNTLFISILGWVCATIIVLLNVLLIYQTLGGVIPGTS
jgi:Mn2+/Fe2+ NRAMP family transporter